MAESSNTNIAEACAGLTLADDDDYEIVVPRVAVETEPEALRYCLVGRLVTDKPIKFPFFKDTMAAAWRPGRGVSIREIQPKLYLFQFFHEFDMRRILEDGPWTYEQNLLVLQS